MTYFKVSVLLYGFLIGVGAFIWNKSGIVSTMIFYGASFETVLALGLLLIGIIGIIQGIAYMIYRGLKAKI